MLFFIFLRKWPSLNKGSSSLCGHRIWRSTTRRQIIVRPPCLCPNCPALSEVSRLVSICLYLSNASVSHVLLRVPGLLSSRLFFDGVFLSSKVRRTSCPVVVLARPCPRFFSFLFFLLGRGRTQKINGAPGSRLARQGPEKQP